VGAEVGLERLQFIVEQDLPRLLVDPDTAGGVVLLG
jgi:hypothetical protein